MRLKIDAQRKLFKRDIMIYGHFLEHFHRQIYGGVFEPGSPLSDDDGFRVDVMDALKKIRVPVIRWPGGCFVSSYHWKKAVGANRVASFDKSWRVEDDNSFGTDEFIKLCGKLGCEPYICLNAGTGSIEEMSDWVEYCNLDHEGEFAKWRIANGHRKPYEVKYWSIGNENYGAWELGAKDSDTWSRLVEESAKLITHVDPNVELTAAALDDIDWNVKLLTRAGERLKWISIHGYWDGLWNVDEPADYMQVMAMSGHTGDALGRVRGLLKAMNLDKSVKIAYDEWNLRGWHHPAAHTVEQGKTPEEYLYPRDRNDINSTYTMADAVFTACFLNTMLRNADVVGMANFAPAVNTRGAIYVYPEGIVKRTTYHVFDMFANMMGDTVLDSWASNGESMICPVKGSDRFEATDCVDAVATLDIDSGKICVSLINRHPEKEQQVIVTGVSGKCRSYTLCGNSP
ncbi:MAG: alpha-L-arabinofuranosidase C-terminal domain-containing protein, partial [Clostridia bacterium]|nr:alpha-L-arabinofuranosidase C-terminal domain-containing protein [Clostridia bacterium]